MFLRILFDDKFDVNFSDYLPESRRETAGDASHFHVKDITAPAGAAELMHRVHAGAPWQEALWGFSGLLF